MVERSRFGKTDNTGRKSGRESEGVCPVSESGIKVGKGEEKLFDSSIAIEMNGSSLIKDLLIVTAVLRVSRRGNKDEG